MNKVFQVESKRSVFVVKKIYFLLVCTMMVYLLTACSSKTMKLDFENVTNIEIINGTTGKSVTLDVEQTDKLAAKLVNIEFKKDKSSKETGGWSYCLKLLDTHTELDKISIMSNNTINYNDYFYKDSTSSINIDYLESLFE